jgi:hypothetical protein
MPLSRVAVDFHLHFYRNYDEKIFWPALCANLARGASQTTAAASPLERVALLTEAAGCDMFSVWAARSGTGPAPYEFRPTAEAHSLALWRNGERSLLVIRGRQIVTRERLEVLTAGPLPAIPDGRPLPAVVDELTAAGALAIIPWGAGKWLGRRGRLVRETAARLDAATFFLADNPARPWFWPAPRLFREQSECGRAVLRGSDPLPIGGEEKRAGAYASLFEGNFDPDRPLASLTAMLAAGDAVRSLGRQDTLAGFFWRQSRLRCRKRV